MARQARVKSRTGEYIILLRGIDEELFGAKKTRDLFLDLCQYNFGDRFMGAKFSSGNVVAVVKESDKGISVDMKPVLISFARTMNREGGKDGKVFRDRFKSLPIEEESFRAECMAYINGNGKKDPFEPKAQRKPAAKNEKTTEKIEKSSQPKSEIKAEEKPKRRNDMPTWLL